MSMYVTTENGLRDAFTGQRRQVGECVSIMLACQAMDIIEVKDFLDVIAISSMDKNIEYLSESGVHVTCDVNSRKIFLKATNCPNRPLFSKMLARVLREEFYRNSSCLPVTAYLKSVCWGKLAVELKQTSSVGFALTVVEL